MWNTKSDNFGWNLNRDTSINVIMGSIAQYIREFDKNEEEIVEEVVEEE